MNNNLVEKTVDSYGEFNHDKKVLLAGNEAATYNET
jgi:hypothetical protein